MACVGASHVDLKQAREITDKVFKCVSEDNLYARPVPERHRLIFYVGHLEAFDRNLLRTALDIPVFAEQLDKLFAFGIDPPIGQLPSDQRGDWPVAEQVRQYVADSRDTIDAAWSEAPLQLRHVAIEHRLMHAETLAYLLHNLPHDSLIAPAVPESAETGGPHRAEMVPVPAGKAILGRCPNHGFGWDNEFPEVHEDVPEFSIGRWKVTNGEYLSFVESGAQPPAFWRRSGDRWLLRRMFDEIPLPLDWPVWVTQQEASDYALWVDCDLPTEAQWHRAADGLPDIAATGNFDGRRWDPAPVDAFPESASTCGAEDLYGNGWEWTSTRFRPFPGFQAFPFYRGYSADFFDDDHFVLKGASPRTDGVFTRRSFRNWFRKDYPYVFATFRCIHKSQ